MSFTRRLSFVSLAAVLALEAPSAEKKDEKKDSPKIISAVPFVIATGATNKVIVRGLSLTNASEVRFPSQPRNLIAAMGSRGKALITDKADPKKVGDTQVELELVLPDDFPAGDLPFGLTTPEGDTNTNLLWVIEKGLRFIEQEPNGAFRKPNDIAVPQMIQGAMGETSDVDVFRFRGKAGQQVTIATKSVRYGSSLDPTVTLYDAKGHVLATSDDAAGLDGHITSLLPRDGDYFLGINDAHDRGGRTYTYLLELR